MSRDGYIAISTEEPPGSSSLQVPSNETRRRSPRLTPRTDGELPAVPKLPTRMHTEEPLGPDDSIIVSPRQRSAPTKQQGMEEDSTIQCIDFNSGRLECADLKSINDLQPRPKWASVRWLDFDGIDKASLETVAKVHKLHYLHIQAVTELGRRPRVEVQDAILRSDNEFEDMLTRQNTVPLNLRKKIFQSSGSRAIDEAKTSLADTLDRMTKAKQSEEKEESESSTEEEDTVISEYVFVIANMTSDRGKTMEQVSFFLIGDTLVTVQEGLPGDVWDGIRMKINKAGSRIRTGDASYLLCVLLEALVDSFAPAIQSLGQTLEDMELEILNKPTKAMHKKVYSIKRELLLLRKNIFPMLQAVSVLTSDKCPISEPSKPCFKGLVDSLVQLNDTLETYRELGNSLSGLFPEYRQDKMNSVLYVLTIVSVIFTPLGFITGVYGTNWDNVPELHWEYGYQYMWGLFFVILLIELAVFAKTGVFRH